MSKCIVPISGGLDSTVLLHYAVKSGRFDNVYAVSFNYGQRHDKELLYAEKTVKELKIPHKVVDLRFFNSIADTSSLTNPDIDVAKTRDVLGDAQTVNYVPFRNQMLLTICSAMAESAGADTVFHGAAQVDTQAGYWDGSEEFVDVVNNVTDLNRENRVVIEAPLLDMSKAEIIKEGARLGVKFKDTWTCYSDRKDKLADATTPSSSMRVKGFVDAGLKDPIAYIQQEKLDKLYEENNCKECA